MRTLAPRFEAHAAILIALLSLSVGAAACASDDASDASDADVTAAAGLFGDETAIFQDDRVGRQLKSDLKRIPSDYPSYESLFKVGRQCARPDKKKEIFIVEESQTRGAGGESDTGRIMPRAVITGCNTKDPSVAENLKGSYSLMTALVSDDGEPGAAKGDTMSLSPLEVMAYDDTTGLFNFYVFEPSGPGKPGTVTRFWRAKDGTVMTRRLEAGAKAPTPAKANGDNACFRCHVNGAPLMNEISEPWTNWISPKKSLPTSTMSGTTKELVSQASLADQLETIIRRATEDYLEGKTPKNGWVNRTRDAELPGGVSELVKPLFCETELNYLSADTTLGVPKQVFFDPSVTAAAELSFPDPPSTKVVPFLFPVRSARDQIAESVLIGRNYVTTGTVVAIRLVDDENDVFSAKRCGLLGDVKRELDKLGASPPPKKVSDVLRSVVASKLPTLGLQPARLAYAKARIDEKDFEGTQVAYNAELEMRFEKMDRKVPAREAARKAQARKMFPGRFSPLPDLDPPK